MVDYCIFILTNRRPDKQLTFRYLKKTNVSLDKIFFVVDNLDPTIEEYKKKYKKQVIVFDKNRYINEVDTMLNKRHEGAVVYARNACYDLAKDLGYRYFLMLDDDYKTIDYLMIKEKSGIKKQKRITKLEEVNQAYFEFLNIRKDIYTVCFCQTGELIGGIENSTLRTKFYKRKMMNAFFLDTEKRIYFDGILNEDVNANLEELKKGHLCFTFFNVVLGQIQTQKNKGGLTELYLDLGTYKKSFFSVMNSPNAVKVGLLNSIHTRFHHLTDYSKLKPEILNENVKKPC